MRYLILALSFLFLIYAASQYPEKEARRIELNDNRIKTQYGVK